MIVCRRGGKHAGIIIVINPTGFDDTRDASTRFIGFHIDRSHVVRITKTGFQITWSLVYFVLEFRSFLRYLLLDPRKILDKYETRRQNNVQSRLYIARDPEI